MDSAEEGLPGERRQAYAPVVPCAPVVLVSRRRQRLSVDGKRQMIDGVGNAAQLDRHHLHRLGGSDNNVAMAPEARSDPYHKEKKNGDAGDG
jgi:hypothetical protein